jgi:hypothetical protein
MPLIKWSGKAVGSLDCQTDFVTSIVTVEKSLLSLRRANFLHSAVII